LEELSQDNVAPSERNRDLSILYELLADKSKEADTWQQKRNLVKQRLDSDNKLLERLPPDDKLSERSLLKRQN
jgi:hypothetical protein